MNNIAQKAIIAFGLVMVMIFLASGIIFLFTDIFIDAVPRPNRTYLAFVFFVYVILRSVRIYQQYNRLKREENED